MTIVPILLYHGISANPSEKMESFTVSPGVFSRHMDLIVDGGYRCLTVSELVDEMSAPEPDLRNVALVTFDDGYADFSTEALPILTERNLASTMYITTGYVDSPANADIAKPEDPILSWSEIAALPSSSVAVEVGAHSHSHPQMDTLSSAEVREELVRSKVLLEDALGSRVRSFAYPHGYNSPRVRRQTVEAGYDSAAAVRNALSHSTDDPYRLARLTVRSFTEDELVANWLSGQRSEVATSKESMKARGWRAYRNVKRVGSRLTPVRG